jgi:hypothetical protein
MLYSSSSNSVIQEFKEIFPMMNLEGIGLDVGRK